MKDKVVNTTRCDNVWCFFLLAYTLSWIFWIPASLLRQESSALPIFVLYLLGGFGPSIAGVIMIDRSQDKIGQRDFLRRSFSFKLIGGRWYALILLVFPVFAILSVLLYLLAEGAMPSIPSLTEIGTQPIQLLFLPIIAIQVIITGPLSEEIGWRGLALDKLQAKWSSLVASLTLGLFWSLWHLPLFFLKNNLYYEWGFGTVAFWLFLLRMPMLSLLMTWVYNNNQRSILSAILMHFTFNFTFGFFQPAPVLLHLFVTTVFCVAGVVVAIMWGPKTLARQKRTVLTNDQVHRSEAAYR